MIKMKKINFFYKRKNMRLRMKKSLTKKDKNSA